MDAKLWERVGEVFHQALERAPAVRQAFLDEACGGEGELRAAVAQLLVDDASSASGLEAGAVALEELSGGALGSLAPIEAGAEVGPYRVLAPIGSGGMGVVYLAEQTAPVKRQVALKVIRLGMDSAAILARFEAERQVLALMSHRGIATIHDAGVTADGRPWFAMEHVPGRPITSYCDEARLTVRARLELFVQVCRAIQHAHQKGVIHRDVKPSNVLVHEEDGAPIPKVIDFGIAKATGEGARDGTELTRHDAFLGTPEYVSPEQARGGAAEVDTRSDIYSLGVVLYELLVGALPYDVDELHAGGRAGFERVLNEADAPRPSTRLGEPGVDGDTSALLRGTDRRALTNQLKGDLDWIVLKALEKEPARRYASASELAADVERHLAHEPVSARPPDALYRLARFARRHRTFLAASVVAALALLGGSAAAVVGLVRARDAEEQALEDKTAAELASADSETVTAFVAGMLGSLSALELGRDARVRDVLDDAARSVESRFAERPRLEARVRGMIGDGYLSLGMLAEARPHLARAHALALEAYGVEDARALEAGLALGICLGQLGEYQRAEELLTSSYREAARVLGSADRRTLKAGLAYVEMLRDRGDERAAVTLHEELVARAERELGPTDRDTLAAAHRLGVLYRVLGRIEQAERRVLATIEIAGEAYGPDDPEVLEAQRELANVHRANRDPRELELLRHVVDGQARVLGPDHPETVLSSFNLASTLLEAGALEEAGQLMTDIIALEEGRGRGEYRTVLAVKSRLAKVLTRSGRADAARELGLATLAAQERVMGRLHRDTRETLTTLGEIERVAGRHEACLEHRADALRRIEEHGGVHPAQAAEALLDFGAAHQSLGRHEEALELFREAVEAFRAAKGAGDERTVEAVIFLSQALVALDRRPEAYDLLLASWSELEAELGPEHPGSAELQHRAAHMAGSLGELETNEELLRGSLEAALARGVDAAKSQEYERCLRLFLERQGRDDEAEAHGRRMGELRRESDRGDELAGER